MKRFITYLYEYEQGQKIKNTGFIRVDERNGMVNLQVCVRNYIRSHEKGKIYAFFWNNTLTGIVLGEVGIINGQGDVRLQFSSDNVMDSEYCLDEMAGVGIQFPNNGYVASCWNDDVMEMISNGRFETADMQKIKMEEMSEVVLAQNQEISQAQEFQQAQELPQIHQPQQLQELKQLQEPQQLQELKRLQEPQQVQELPQAQELQQSQEACQLPEVVSYQKMELNEIRNLPSPNWYLCNNRFLVHGFFNYGYLVLKKTADTDGEKAYLGVPGFFEKPEMVMATLFGFPEFEALPKAVSAAQMGEALTIPDIEKSQEPKDGTFGCWLVPLQV